MPFSKVTASEVESFIDNLRRSGTSNKPLSVKRIKNLLNPMAKVWESACNEYNWHLRSPFGVAAEKYKN